jgi:hypothetical protein
MKYCLLIPLLLTGCGNGSIDTRSNQVIEQSRLDDQTGYIIYRVNQPNSYRGDWQFISTNSYRIGQRVTLVID